MSDGLITTQELSQDLKDKLNEIGVLSTTSTQLTTDSIISIPQDSKQAPIKLILEGRTISNSVINGNFKDGTNGWTGALGGVLTASNNTLSIASNNTHPSPYTYRGTNIPAIAGKKIFVRCKFKVNNAVCKQVRLGIQAKDATSGGTDSIDATSVFSPSENVSYLLSNMLAVPDNKSETIRVYIQHIYEDVATVDGKVIEIQEVMAIDIDQHPELQGLTAEEINARIPHYIDGMQSIEGLKVRSVGKNYIQGEKEQDNSLFNQGIGSSTYDNVWKDGKLRVSNGSGHVRGKGTKVRVVAGKTYTFRCMAQDSDANARVDIGYNDITDFKRYYPNINGSVTFTPMYDEIHLRFVRNGVNDDTQPVYFWNIQLEEGEVATEYEPYTETSTFIAEGLYQLPNGVKDTIRGNMLTRRISNTIEVNGAKIKTVIHIKRHTNATSTHFVLNTNLVPTLTRVSNDNADVVINDKRFTPQSLWGVDNIIWDTPNQYGLSNTLNNGNVAMSLSLANTDTGWGNNHTPTADEIRAYFNGWKMFEANGNKVNPYNGTGIKAWYPVSRVNDPYEAQYAVQNNVPTSLAPNTNAWRPCQLRYELAETETKQLDLSTLIAKENGHVIAENWGKYVLKAEDLTTLNTDSYDNINWTRISLAKLVGYGAGVAPIENRVVVVGFNRELPNSIDAYRQSSGYDFSTDPLYLSFLLPKSITTLQQAKTLLEGTVIYYKLAPEYSVDPSWSIEVPTSLKAQINENSNEIAKASSLLQEHADLLETQETRLNNLISNQVPMEGGKFSGIITANSNTSYTLAQIRNVILSPNDADVNAMQDGEIWIKYK